MIKLNIVTPLSRGENLWALGGSIEEARFFDNFETEVKWWIVKDPTCSPIEDTVDLAMHFPFAEFIEAEKSALAGHGHRNLILNKIESQRDEFFYSLDDDNIIHPLFIRIIKENQVYDGVIGSQLLKGDTLRLKADPNKVHLNNIDTAQFCIRLSLIKGLRFDENRYDADGAFIEEIYRKEKHRFVVLDKPICYYNYLR